MAHKSTYLPFIEKALNITNGDSVVGIMKEANIPGEFLPWGDPVGIKKSFAGRGIALFALSRER